MTTEFTNKEILVELGRILSNNLFSRSSVLSNFLKFVVKETLEGRTEGLKEYTIGVSALGKSSDFNPQIDAIVRIHAGRLRRLLNEYYMGPGLSDPIKIEVVKGTYVPVFRPYIINNSKKDNADKRKPISHHRSKLTCAVLPFRNLCSDNNYAFFVNGFGEELTRIFSTCPDIAVIAHHSTLNYATDLVDLRNIGAELGVHYLIIGSVRRSSKEIRVSIGLVETLNGVQIWSKNYKHALETDNIMDIQDRIVEEVFATLSGHYGFIVRHKVNTVLQVGQKLDLITFDAILWNYYAQMTHSLKACMMARKALEKAIAKNPNNALCLIVLGDLYLYSYSLGYPTIDDPINEAHKLIKRGVAAAPLSPYAHMIHGWVNIYLGRKNTAIEEFEYCFKLEPLSASERGTLGFGMACAGEYKHAYTLLHQSLDLNPHCPWWHHMGLYFTYYQSGKYKEALSHAHKMNASNDVFLVPLLRAAAKGQLGLISESQPDLEILKQQFHDVLADPKLQLGTFLLDNVLIDNIINGVMKAKFKLDTHTD